MSVRILVGDVRARLADLPSSSVQTVVTSPPYFGLRDYGTALWNGGDPACDHLQSNYDRGVLLDASERTDGGGASAATANIRRTPYRATCGKCGATRADQQIGLESSLSGYLDALVDVFRAVRRVLRDDGTLWLNIGDSYTSGGRTYYDDDDKLSARANGNRPGTPDGLKPKDLMLVPARLAIALQDDGWYLRSDCIWHKRAPMPESVQDRPTSAHEHIFLLTKRPRYFYDATAVAEMSDPDQVAHNQRYAKPYAAYDDRAADTGQPGNVNNVGIHSRPGTSGTRNLRNVWTLSPEPFPAAHFAVFPTEIPRRCIKAGSRPGDTVLDPFLGSGTTLLVADELGRDGIGIELSPEYARMAYDRIYGASPMFAAVTLLEQRDAIISARDD